MAVVIVDMLEIVYIKHHDTYIMAFIFYIENLFLR